jgi:adenine-specific DNA-methyltransferase
MGTVAAKASSAGRQSPALAQPPPREVEHGAVFTKRWVVELVLDLAGYTADRPLGELVAVEPACGDGAFLVPMVERLSDACKREGQGLLDALGAIRAYDLQQKHVLSSRGAVAATLTGRGWPRKEAVHFAEKAVRKGDFLLAAAPPKADFVLGNPPYIRLESVPAKRSDAYRRACETMSGRADIYVGFFEIGLRALVEGGVLSFICADRWMRNQYGRLLRQLVADGFGMETVVEMHTVDAFDTEVSAYPAITAIRKGPQGPAVVAEAIAGFGPAEARKLVGWRAAAKPEQEHRTDAVRAAVLSGWFDGPSSWPGGPPGRLAVLKDLESRFPTLEDESSGTRVGIGVATGADRVFVTADTSVVEADRLLPLAMAYDTMAGRLEWSEHHLVNPWRADGGGLVDLDDFPRLRAYFEAHGKQLNGRNVARRRPHDWFRTIDRVDPALTGRRKLLFPDIKASIHPVLDDGDTYPHHNLYFVVSRDWDLEVLGGLLLSRVAQLFIEAYAVRMRGNYLRFQAQYLRRIRVPRPGDVGKRDARALRTAFRKRDVDRATAVAERLYGVELPG